MNKKSYNVHSWLGKICSTYNVHKLAGKAYEDSDYTVVIAVVHGLKR